MLGLARKHQDHIRGAWLVDHQHSPGVYRKSGDQSRCRHCDKKRCFFSRWNFHRFFQSYSRNNLSLEWVKCSTRPTTLKVTAKTGILRLERGLRHARIDTIHTLFDIFLSE